MPSANPPPPGARSALDEQMMRSLRTYVGSVETYIAAASEAHHLHRTDLTALSIVTDQAHHGVTVTPGVLTKALGLSASATTSMLDRLEKAGHVVRSVHPEDRRSVMVELTELAEQTGDRLFSPLSQVTQAVLDTYDEDQKQLLVSFLDDLSRAAGDVTATVARGDRTS